MEFFNLVDIPDCSHSSGGRLCSTYNLYLYRLIFKKKFFFKEGKGGHSKWIIFQKQTLDLCHA